MSLKKSDLVTVDGTKTYHGSCIICGTEHISINQQKNRTIYNCTQCGLIILPNKMLSSNDFLDNIPEIAGFLYETENKEIELNDSKVKQILNDPRIPKTPMEYLDKLILHIYSFGGTRFLREIKEDLINPAMGYVKDFDEIFQMIHALIDLGYLKKTESSYMDEQDDGSFQKVATYYYHLTASGIQYAETLIRNKKKSKRAFIAMSFDNEFDVAYDNGIHQACNECHFLPVRVDKKEFNDDIIEKIILEIKKSRFVIADFTESNPGVYFEAGYAKALGCPVIKTCRRDYFDQGKVHFDISHDKFIIWDDESDLRKKLIQRIKLTILQD